MKRILVGLLGLAAVGSVQARAQIQSLDSLGDSTQAQTTITIACGDLQKANCAQVLPDIAQYSTASLVNLAPVSSRGSVQSAEGLCKGMVEAAVGQHDAFALVEQSTQCANSFTAVGRPLYPYFGFLVVNAKNPAGSLSDLVADLPSGRSVQIADGKVGSGGQVTFGNILATDQNLRDSVAEKPYDWTVAESQVEDGQLDGYFVMDAPGSPLIQSIKAEVEPGTKKPLFKFLDVRPGPRFYALKDWQGVPLYQQVVVSENCWLCDRTKTVSTWAELFVNSQWANQDQNESAYAVLQKSVDQADASIRAATLTPKDWTGVIGGGQ